MGIVVIVSILGGLTIPFIDSLNEEGKLEVLILSGQSNSAYRNYDVELVNEEIALPSTNVYYYGTESQPIYYGQTPETGGPTYDTTFESYGIYSMISDGAWKIGSYEPVLAKYISDRTNSDVLIINTGISAASIDYLLPTSDGGQYVEEVIEHAIADIDSTYTLDKLGFVWIQGEADYSTAVSTYVEKFTTIFDWYASLGFGDCYMVETQLRYSGNANTAQNLICEENSHVYLASTSPETFTVSNGLLASDDLHYSQAGRIIVAEDICEVLKLPTHLDKNIFNLLNIVPVVIICAMIAGVSRIIISSKRD